eukprot:scaffold84121_cov105-Phaeocystis_antarctica.AAC.6
MAAHCDEGLVRELRHDLLPARQPAANCTEQTVRRRRHLARQLVRQRTRRLAQVHHLAALHDVIPQRDPLEGVIVQLVQRPIERLLELALLVQHLVQLSRRAQLAPAATVALGHQLVDLLRCARELRLEIVRRAALLIQLLLLPPKGRTQVGELLLQIARLLHGVARLRVIKNAQLQLSDHLFSGAQRHLGGLHLGLPAALEELLAVRSHHVAR